VSTKEILLNSATTALYLVSTPEQIYSLYDLSALYLVHNQFKLKEDDRCTLLEQHFYLSLLTGNNQEAKVMLQRLTDRFGVESSRIGILMASYLESTEGDNAMLEYLNTREETDFASKKKRAGLLKHSPGNEKSYIQALVKYLEYNPLDPEAWSELAETYYKTGNYPQAIYSLEEILLQLPQTYNIYARIGEIYNAKASTKSGNIGVKDKDATYRDLQLAVTNFSRSVELCPVYVRGWSGL
ncbi:hypothetical protein NADFUDRAFT_11181, partial [Nadsonia fulvescens var. elongata DSM 6958]